MHSVVGTQRRADRPEPGVVRLDDPSARDAGLVGAKASALAVAAEAGLPVLPGVVVTTGFDGADDFEALRAEWVSLSHSGELPLVVRSSSTIEDSATSSMAGMFTSILDVSGWDGFRAALDAVLASRNVVPLNDGARTEAAPMAVLVQPYLAASSGGVMFGLDPVSGRSDHIVVSASEHGPAAVVGGDVDGVQYVLRPSGRLVSGRTGPLSRTQLRQLARLSGDVRRVFGGPQDVEWAFDGTGELHLLQSRPVTARGDVAPATGPVFGPGPVAETFPNPLTTLEFDLWGQPLADALRQALLLAGTTSKRRVAASPIVTSVGGRLAADLTVFPASARPASFAARLDPRPPLRRLAGAWRVGQLRAALPALAADLVARADADLLAVDHVADLSEHQLLNLLHAGRQGLIALHGHEMLMGWLVEPGSTAVTATSVALRAVARGRAEGLADDQIVARFPGVLALTVPAVGAEPHLPPVTDLAAVEHGGAADADAADPAVLREALRLRARWLHELTARAAWELGRRLHARGRLAEVEHVRHLHLDELEAAVRTGAVPEDVPQRALSAHAAAPLPARFRLTAGGGVVAVRAKGRKANAAGGARGAGGGRGSGLVEAVSPRPTQGAVLVVRTLDPDLAPILPRLGGLVAETGSPLSHLAILARELGVPTAVGVEGALTRFPPGSQVVVDGATGEVTRLDVAKGAA